jgi:hypothetical protein
LEALERLCAETPAEEFNVAVEEFLKSCNGANSGDISISFRTGLSLEASALIWFLDAQIPFAQFSSELFQDFIRKCGVNVREFAKSTTMTKVILPMLYQFCVSRYLEIFARCRSFYTSFDGWSRFNNRYISQTYHVIDPTDFKYHQMLLDFCVVNTAHYSEVIAGVLTHRQEFWTNGIVPEPIAAGGMADGASDGQSAGNLMYGDDDMNQCQNHRLKKC